MIGKNQTRFNRLARAFSPRFPEAHWPRSGLQALYLFGEAAKNLVQFSANAVNSFWQKGGLVVITENAATDHKGRQLAAKMSLNAGLSFHYWRHRFTVGQLKVGWPYTVTVRVKKDTYRYVGVRLHGSTTTNKAVYDFDTNAWIYVAGGYTALAPKALANGYIELSVVKTITSAEGDVLCGISITNSSGKEDWTATGTESIFIESLWLNMGATPLRYVPTTDKLAIPDLSGKGNDVNLGQSPTAHFGADGALHLPGTVGNYLGTADAPINRITGDLELRATFVQREGVTTQASHTALVSKWVSGLSYILELRKATANHLKLTWKQADTTIMGAESTVPLPITLRVPIEVAATLDVDNGSGKYELKYFYRNPGVASWTQLGDTITGLSTTDINSSTDEVRLGSQGFSTDGRANIWNGQIWNGIEAQGGSLVVDCDPPRDALGADVDSFVSSTTGERYDLYQSSPPTTNNPIWEGDGLQFAANQYISGLPAMGSAWTILNTDGVNIFALDSDGGSYINGELFAGAERFLVYPGGGYTGKLVTLAQYGRVLTPLEQMQAFRAFRVYSPGVYLHADFLTDQAAPLPSVLQVDKSALTITDTESKASVSGGQLILSGGKAAPSSNGDPELISRDQYSRINGLAIVGRVLVDSTGATVCHPLSWATGAGGNSPRVLSPGWGSAGWLNLWGDTNGVKIADYVAGTWYDVALILEETGGFVLWRPDGESDYTLLYVETTGTATPVVLQSYTFDKSYKVSAAAIKRLLGQWAKQHGIAVSRLVWPQLNDKAKLDLNGSGENLARQSENFTATPWSTSGVIIASTTEVTPPAGFTNVFKLTKNAGENWRNVGFAQYLQAGTYYLSVRVKKGTGSSIGIKSQKITGTGVGDMIAWFHFDTLTWTFHNNSPDSQGYIDLGGGWYQIWAKITVTGAGTFQLAVAGEDTAAIGAYGYVTGYQVNNGSLKSYVKTDAHVIPEANGFIEFTLDYQGGSTWVAVRQLDSNNRWEVRCNDTGSFDLLENVAGTLTSRGSAATVFTAGNTYKIKVVFDAGTIVGYVDDVQRWSYTDPDLYFIDQADVEVVLHQSPNVLTDLTVYPRLLPSLDLSLPKPTYNLLAALMTDRVAPLPSPFTVDAGQLTILDSANHLSVSGQRIVTDGNGKGWGDPRVVGPALTRVAGLAFSFDFEHVSSDANAWVGFSKAATPLAFDYVDAAVSMNRVRFALNGVGANTFAWTKTTDTHRMIIERPAGAFFLTRDANGLWSLEYLSAASYYSTVYPAFSHVHVGGVKKTGDWKVFDITALDKHFATQYGLAVDRKANPVAGDTFTLPLYGGSNGLLWSEDLTNSVYTFTQVVITPNAIPGPIGLGMAARLQSTSSGHFFKQSYNVTPLQDYVFTFFAMGNGGDDIGYSVYDLTNQVNIVAQTSYKSQLLTGSWVRVEVPFTAPAGCTQVGVYPARDVGSASDIYVVGLQINDGLASLPYQKTEAAPMPQANGIIEFTLTFDGTYFAEVFRKVDANNFWYIQNSTGSALELLIKDAGSFILKASAANVLTATNTYRIVIVIDGNRYMVFVDDVLQIDYTDANNKFIDAQIVETNAVSGGVSNHNIYPRQLPDLEV